MLPQHCPLAPHSSPPSHRLRPHRRPSHRLPSRPNRHRHNSPGHRRHTPHPSLQQIPPLHPPLPKILTNSSGLPLEGHRTECRLRKPEFNHQRTNPAAQSYPDSNRYCIDPKLVTIPLDAWSPIRAPFFGTGVAKTPQISQCCECRPSLRALRTPRGSEAVDDLGQIFE